MHRPVNAAAPSDRRSTTREETDRPTKTARTSRSGHVDSAGFGTPPTSDMPNKRFTKKFTRACCPPPNLRELGTHIRRNKYVPEPVPVGTKVRVRQFRGCDHPTDRVGVVVHSRGRDPSGWFFNLVEVALLLSPGEQHPVRCYSENCLRVVSDLPADVVQALEGLGSSLPLRRIQPGTVVFVAPERTVPGTTHDSVHGVSLPTGSLMNVLVYIMETGSVTEINATRCKEATTEQTRDVLISFLGKDHFKKQTTELQAQVIKTISQGTDKQSWFKGLNKQDAVHAA